MKKNLYEYFNCKNKDELYELVKNKDENVKKLIDYIEHAKKENMLERTYKITCLDDIEEAFRKGDIINPSSDEISLIFLDSSNNIINNKVFNQETSLEDIMLESYSSVARSFILMNGENATRKTLNLGDDLQTIGFKEIDILSKEKENIFYSKLGNSSEDFGVSEEKEKQYNFSNLSKKVEVDKDIALFAVQKEASNYLFLDEKYRNDKQIIENVLKNGNNLVLLDSKHRNNLEIVKIAIKNNPESIEYASKELQEKLSREKENPWKKKIENSKSKGLGR